MADDIEHQKFLETAEKVTAVLDNLLSVKGEEYVLRLSALLSMYQLATEHTRLTLTCAREKGLDHGDMVELAEFLAFRVKSLMLLQHSVAMIALSDADGENLLKDFSALESLLDVTEA